MQTSMQTVFCGLVSAALFQPLAFASPLTSFTLGVSPSTHLFRQARTILALSPSFESNPSQPLVAAPRQLAQQTPRSINSVVLVALPISATVWLKVGGSTIGKVMGFDAKQQLLTLGISSIQFTKINKVAFDHKALAYRSNGTIVFRGEDPATAKQSTWRNLAFSAFQVKDSKLGQAQVNLNGVIKPIEVKGIQSVAVKSVYVVDEIQFQPDGKMTIKVTASDR